MTIYVTGDTHKGIDSKKLSSDKFLKGKSLTKNDYVVILGDFGLFPCDTSQEFLKWINNKEWTTLIVEGNNEDYNYLKTFPIVKMFGSKVRKINDYVYQLLRGEVYEIEGKKIFTFGGARSLDKESSLKIEGVDWFSEEECTYEEECYALDQLSKYNYKVDYIFTHTCAKSTLDELSKAFNIYIEDYDNQNIFLEKVKNKVDYSIHCFGHIHKDYRVNDKEIAIYDRVVNVEDLINNKKEITFEF